MTDFETVPVGTMQQLRELEAHVERLTRYAKEARLCLDHARVFISTRQKMHECGREAHDECLACLTQTLEDAPNTSLARLKAECWKDAYLAGWQASCEGWNDEHPGDADKRDSWIEERDEWIRRQSEEPSHD